MEDNKKLIDLGILSEDEVTGVKKVSLVEDPAIMLDFRYFNKQVKMSKVDNKGMEKFKEFLDENKDLMKKPGGGPAGDGGVDHGAQMAILEEKGIDTDYPFGYCFQIAQFLFYALGGYDSEWDLMCIKKMEYQVDGVDFQSTHWYVQSKESGRIVDLSAEQFEGILDIEDYYEDGRRANLGFPYYNVGEDRVEFEETVPSIMTLKLYNKWKEENGELEGIEKYYQACQYEEYRMSMQFSEVELPYREEFVKPSPGESKDDFIGRCISVVRGEGKPEDQAAAICYSYWENMEIDTAGLSPYVDPGDKKQKLVTKAILMEECPMDYNWMEDDYIVETILKLAEELGTKEKDLAELFKKECFANPGAGGSGTSVASVAEQGDKKLYLYKYEGRITNNSRPFCVGMVGLDNFYTKAQIQAMSDIAVNPGFGVDGASTYSIWSFKGGPNCKHAWRQYLVTMPNGQITIEYVKPAAGRAGTEPYDMPKRGYYNSIFKFAADDKQVLVGPCMVPEINIPRLDDSGDTYFVKFSPETIKEIMMKYFKEKRTNDLNTDHEENEAGAYIFESWIVEDPETDKANTVYGYNVPAGTWMITVKVDDLATWRRVKAGELRGFSIEGILLDMEELEAKKKYEKIRRILRDK
jgi:hypothetical protein